MSNVIVVSNRLPVQLTDNGDLIRSSGGLASAMNALGDSVGSWVGWPGPVPGDPAALEVRLREEQGCVPVFVEDQALYDDFYTGYANGTLWPLMHYMLERADFKPTWFDAYRQVNQRFADRVLEVAKPGDRVWVHDYQLMLVPGMLREARPDLRIGYFHHVPFPSQEIFRMLPEREAMLRGLLGADVIGFHTFGYLRHFRSALLRVLDLESDPDKVQTSGRSVSMGVYPIGHNRARFDSVIDTPAFRTQLEELEREFHGRRMVLSVERLDYTKGIPEKLDSIEHFLAQHPEHHEDIVFLILAVPSRESVDAYRDLTDEVRMSVGDINGRFSTFSRQPVHFYHRGVDPTRLAALYAFAEVALVTPLVDGMNLVAKEYIDCKGAPGARPGTLILSETAGAAQELAGALLVNPYDVTGVVKALDEALSRTPEERRNSTEPMRRRVRRRDAGAWAKTFVDALDSQDSRSSDPTAELDDAMVDRLASAPTLGVVLDYDGTLRSFVPRPEDAVPTPELLSILDDLVADEGVRLAIVSGRPEQFLEKHLGHLDAVLYSEHGFRRRNPGGDWVDANPQADLTWLEVVRPFLEQASDLTPGTHVEAKTSALVWHYRRADPEFGAWKASELLNTLTYQVANMPVEVHHGHKIVEVASQQVSKGAALDALLALWTPDAAIAIGDDRTDETMFQRRDHHPHLQTIKVGGGETKAAWRVADVAATHAFLRRLVTLRNAEG